MSDFKGTPAPWHVFGLMGLDVRCSTGHVVARDIYEKDANLISAAPELLEACMRSRNQLYAAGYEGKEVSYNPIEELLYQTEKAIEKALGK